MFTCSLTMSWWLSIISSNLSHLASKWLSESTPPPATVRSNLFLASAFSKSGLICKEHQDKSRTNAENSSEQKLLPQIMCDYSSVFFFIYYIVHYGTNNICVSYLLSLNWIFYYLGKRNAPILWFVLALKFWLQGESKQLLWKSKNFKFNCHPGD